MGGASGCQREQAGPDQSIRGRLIIGLKAELGDLNPGLTAESALDIAKSEKLKLAASGGTWHVSNESSRQVIYFGDEAKAVPAYAVSFLAHLNDGESLTRPTVLVDGSTGKILFQYDGLAKGVYVEGTGPGGNLKAGQYEYGTDRPGFTVWHENGVSHMDDSYVRVINMNGGTTNMSTYTYQGTRNTYRYTNGAYAPLNDAYANAQLVTAMYQAYYGQRPLQNEVAVKVNYGQGLENALWDGQFVILGDGGLSYYPLTDLGTISHEIAHGFTQQNANLIYTGHPGGINESFSDMAAEAAEYYATGTNDWLIAHEVTKTGSFLRNMADPASDCALPTTSDQCSIDHVKDYYRGLEIHYSSGIYNKVFYQLATTPGWNTKKAFDVFLKANKCYWTESESFQTGAEAAFIAAGDLNYSTEDVAAAFREVGIYLDTDIENPDGRGSHYKVELSDLYVWRWGDSNSYNEFTWDLTSRTRPTGGSINKCYTQNSYDVGWFPMVDTIFDQQYSWEPDHFEFNMRAWEDDRGSRCLYNNNGGVFTNDDDNYREGTDTFPAGVPQGNHLWDATFHFNGDFLSYAYKARMNIIRTFVPKPPTNLRVSGSTDGRNIFLNWDIHSQVASGYHVERSINGAPFYHIETMGDDESGYAVGGQPGTEYVFRVRATNMGRAFSPYTQTVAIKDGLVAPTLYATRQGVAAILLSWSDLQTNSISGYRLYRRVNSSWIQIASLASSQTSYVDQGLVDNTSYTYRIVAFEGNRISPFSNEASTRTANYPTLQVSLDGPTTRQPQEFGTWTAGATGGNGTYQYVWKINGVLQNVPNYFRFVYASTSSFTVTVAVSSGSQTVEKSLFVRMQILGGCPFVFVETVDGFVRDNNLLHRSSFTGNVGATMLDRYLLEARPLEQDGIYRIRVEELNADHSYLDQIALAFVDHPTGTELAVTDQNEIVSLKSQAVVNPRWQVTDGITLPLDEDRNAVIQAGTTLEIIIPAADYDQLLMLEGIPGGRDVRFPVPDEKFPTATLSGMPGVEMDLAFRESGSMQSVILPATTEDQTIKLFFHRVLHIREPRLAPITAIYPKQTVMQPVAAIYPNGEEVVSLLENRDGDFAELTPGAYITLDFEAPKSNAPSRQDDSFERSFLLVTSGYYLVPEFQNKEVFNPIDSLDVARLSPSDDWAREQAKILFGSVFSRDVESEYDPLTLEASTRRSETAITYHLDGADVTISVDLLDGRARTGKLQIGGDAAVRHSLKLYSGLDHFELLASGGSTMTYHFESKEMPWCYLVEIHDPVYQKTYLVPIWMKQ